MKDLELWTGFGMPVTVARIANWQISVIPSQPSCQCGDSNSRGCAPGQFPAIRIGSTQTSSCIIFSVPHHLPLQLPAESCSRDVASAFRQCRMRQKVLVPDPGRGKL